MSRHAERNSADDVEPDRIGKMHGRRHREPSVRAQLARRLRGFRGRSGQVGARSSGNPRMQRVIVKTHVARHKAGKAKGSITRHVHYLGRDSASADGKAGVFYDFSRDGLDARKEAGAWAQDRHHFRMIISPERGADIPDMTAYVRQVMQRVEKDLRDNGAIEPGSQLQWVGINHHNTDNPHAHVVLRGKQNNGRDLVIGRAYLAHGMRTRALEVATELLGERTVEQAQEARLKEVEAERFTSLDRMIQRHLDKGRIDLSPAKSIGFGADDRQLALGRLQFLEGIELARKDKGTWWTLAENWDQSLRELGARNDIIRQLYSQLGNEAGRVSRMSGEADASIVGVVIAKGQADELGDDRFVVVRDSASQAHYGKVADSLTYRDLHIGSVAELGAGTQQRRQVTEQIITVSHANGVYSVPLHEDYLRRSQPHLADREIASALRSASSRLAFVAEFEGSGVRAVEEGTYRIDSDSFRKFNQRMSQRTDVRVICEHSLEYQSDAHAVTWLDRHAFSDHPDPRTADHPAVQEAIAQRNQWLVEHGYARRDAESGAVTLRPDALRELAERERDDVTGRLAGKHGLPVVELPQGGMVSGEYQGVEQLHGGKLAVVLAEEQVFVSPVARTPSVDVGNRVELQRTSARRSSVELAAVRGAELQQGTSLDSPAGGER